MDPQLPPFHLFFSHSYAKSSGEPYRYLARRLFDVGNFWVRNLAYTVYSICLWYSSVLPSKCHNRAEQILTEFFIHSFIHQWLYSPLLVPGLFLNSVTFFTRTLGLLGRVISSPQGRCLHTGQHKHRINAGRHHAFERDSNLWSQRSSEW
jgi:hypothetical protein